MDNMPTMSKKMFRVKEVRGGLTSFQTLLKVHEGLSVVFFWAEWADQCAPLDEAFKLLSKDSVVYWWRLTATRSATAREGTNHTLGIH
jgi:hypothetical protein